MRQATSVCSRNPASTQVYLRYRDHQVSDIRGQPCDRSPLLSYHASSHEQGVATHVALRRGANYRRFTSRRSKYNLLEVCAQKANTIQARDYFQVRTKVFLARLPKFPDMFSSVLFRHVFTTIFFLHFFSSNLLPSYSDVIPKLFPDLCVSYYVIFFSVTKVFPLYGF